MNFIRNKQKLIRLIFEKFKRGAEIVLKEWVVRLVEQFKLELKIQKRQTANTARMIDRNASKIQPLTSLTPSRSIRTWI